ncbi:MAG: hypothetical protein LQ352_000139 [Teloschistes flavicans]|nr:MAG: hypothetical protein LQ352_000139 [Teloschistes flavicans]
MGVLLLLIIPLIFLSIYPDLSSTVLKDDHGPLKPRHPIGLTEPSVISTNGTRNIGLAFGKQVYRPTFSIPLARRQVNLEEASNLYVLAECNGSQMLNAIQQATDPNLPAPDVPVFFKPDIGNGWSVQDYVYGRDRILAKRWDAAFGRSMNYKQGRHVTLKQDKPFTNKFGQYQPLSVPAANYVNVLFVDPPTLIAVQARSPTYVFKHPPSGMSQDDIQRRIPPLNRWSDVAWMLWLKGEGATHPDWLRFIGFDRVSDEITVPVIRYIMFTRYMNEHIAFPGVVFNTADEEGRALLGTPTGKGAGWLMRDRGRILNLRARQPFFTIRIWSTDGEYFMLFDLQQNPNQVSKMGTANHGALGSLNPPTA